MSSSFPTFIVATLYLAITGAVTSAVRHAAYSAADGTTPGLMTDIGVNVPAAVLVGIAAFAAAILARRLAPSIQVARWAPVALAGATAVLGMISLGIALVVLGAAAGIWLAMRIVELPSADRAKGVLQLAGVLVPALAVAYLFGRHETNALERAASGAVIPLLAAGLGTAAALARLRRS